MDETSAKERMLETENLTDALEDDDAKWLLDWGIAHIHPVINGITDEDAAGEKVNALMKVMRSLNQISADLGSAAPEDLADEVRTFVERYHTVFGDATDGATGSGSATDATTTTDATTNAATLDDARLATLASQITTMKPREAMQALLASVESPASAPATPTEPPATPVTPATGESANNTLTEASTETPTETPHATDSHATDSHATDSHATDSEEQPNA